MRKSLLLGTLVSLCLSSTAIAETVYFPEEIVPLQVDNEKVEQSFFSRVDELELDPGTYKFKLKYTDLYEQGYDEHQVVDSDPFWVAVTIEQDNDYDIVFNRADNVVAAKVFAQSPLVSLQARGSSLGTPLSSTTEPMQEQVSTTASSTTVTSNSAAVEAQVNQAKSVGSISKLEGGPSAAAMLEFWWQQASAKEQHAFINKVTKSK